MPPRPKLRKKLFAALRMDAGYKMRPNLQKPVFRGGCGPQPDAFHPTSHL
jgi:hypothetical protein